MKHGAALALSVTLAACGSGGDAVCTPQSPVVQLFGDSTLWGYDGGAATGVQAAVTPAIALQTWLDARLGVGAVQVQNRAVSGTDSSQLLAGTDGLNAPWPGSVAAALVVVNFGINDKLRALGEANYRSNLRALAQVPPGARVLFQTPLPVRDAGSPGGVSTSYAEAMRAEALALNIPVADASAFALALPDWFQAYAPDSVHPNSEGYARLAAEVWGPAVLPLLPARSACGS